MSFWVLRGFIVVFVSVFLHKQLPFLVVCLGGVLRSFTLMISFKEIDGGSALFAFAVCVAFCGRGLTFHATFGAWSGMGGIGGGGGGGAPDMGGGAASMGGAEGMGAEAALDVNKGMDGRARPAMVVVSSAFILVCRVPIWTMAQQVHTKQSRTRK